MSPAAQPSSSSFSSSWASRTLLQAKVVGLRQMAGVGFSLQNRAVTPPTRSQTIDVGHGPTKGTIRFDIWEPPKPGTGRPCMLVFHGGGFTVGRGTDDARWANRVVEKVGAVVIGVNYRLAPGHPFPIPVQDGADALSHVLDRAEEYGIDRKKVMLSGFSSGGNLVFSSWILLRQRRQQLDNILGIIAFYPLLDYSISREFKRATAPRSNLYLSPFLTQVFDASYLPPNPNLSDPLLSPAHADDETLQAMPPVHLCCCEYDMLFVEGRDFRDRLDVLRPIKTSWRMVSGVKHGFDKPPPVTPPREAMEEYDAAIGAIQGWLEGMVPKAQAAVALSPQEHNN